MSNGWWEKKLGAPAPQQPVAPAATQYPVSTPPAPVYQQPVQNTPPVQHNPTPRCPGCGSGNYGGTAESRPRCYDCGYPLQQSGSGVGTGIQTGQQSGGPVAPAKQVATGGFNPTTIIGHI